MPHEAALTDTGVTGLDLFGNTSGWTIDFRRPSLRQLYYWTLNMLRAATTGVTPFLS